jgi:hypothetical protein
MDGTIVPVTGTYSVEIGAGDSDLTFTVQAYTVPDLSTPITLGGTAVLTSTTPGQELRYTFTLAQQTRISVTTSYVTPAGQRCAALSIRDATGTIVGYDGTGGDCSFGGLVDAVTLPAGAYTFVAKPGCETNLQVTAHLYNAAEATGTVTINRNGRNFSTTIPGQNVAVRFDGSAGQLATVKLTNLSISGLRVCATVTLFSIDGTTGLAAGTWCRSDGTTFTMPQVTLPTTGTYTIYVDPYNASTISLSAAVTSP